MTIYGMENSQVLKLQNRVCTSERSGFTSKEEIEKGLR